VQVPQAARPSPVTPKTGVRKERRSGAGTGSGAKEVELQISRLGEHNCQRLLFDIANPGY